MRDHRGISLVLLTVFVLAVGGLAWADEEEDGTPESGTETRGRPGETEESTCFDTSTDCATVETGHPTDGDHVCAYEDAGSPVEDFDAMNDCMTGADSSNPLPPGIDGVALGGYKIEYSSDVTEYNQQCLTVDGEGQIWGGSVWLDNRAGPLAQFKKILQAPSTGTITITINDTEYVIYTADANGSMSSLNAMIGGILKNAGFQVTEHLSHFSIKHRNIKIIHVGFDSDDDNITRFGLVLTTVITTGAEFCPLSN